MLTHVEGHIDNGTGTVVQQSRGTKTAKSGVQKKRLSLTRSCEKAHSLHRECNKESSFQVRIIFKGHTSQKTG